MESAFSSSIIDLFLSAGIVAKIVLGILLLGSIASWAIILNKWIAFRRVNKENQRFLAFFSKIEDLEHVQLKALRRHSGPLALVLSVALEKIETFSSRGKEVSVNGMRAMQLSVIERSLQGAVHGEIDYQEHNLHFLATIGNISPFIGLFGTVWGIMGAFQEIGRQGSANIAVVAPGVAEALINTAAGLFVAIPAAVGYNLFVNKIRKMEVQLDVFSSELVSLVEEKMINPSVEQGVR